MLEFSGASSENESLQLIFMCRLIAADRAVKCLFLSTLLGLIACEIIVRGMDSGEDAARNRSIVNSWLFI